jgi:hypothetical protein
MADINKSCAVQFLIEAWDGITVDIPDGNGWSASKILRRVRRNENKSKMKNESDQLFMNRKGNRCENLYG